MMFNILKRRLYLWNLRGTRFFCPLCEKGFKSFLPAGIDNRPNALCPNCGSLERHRLLWLTLLKLWSDGTLKKSGKLLHIAPERPLARKFQKLFDYLSADIDERIAMVKMNITDIQFPDETFDVIICNHVLEHISDDKKALSELLRVLKKGGWASIQVPVSGDNTFEDNTITDPKERERLFGQSDHVRTYGKDFHARLTSAGFTVSIYYKDKIIDPEQNSLFSLECENEIYIATK
jgi:SAM-dependent methyltransferase